MRSNKLRGEIDSYLTSNVGSSRGSKFYAFRANANVKQERTVMRKKIFGEHYNFSKVGLNKEKKYMLEEQKNTEIERSNRILLEKIQRISKRSGSKDHRKRTMTEHGEVTLHFEETH